MSLADKMDKVHLQQPHFSFLLPLALLSSAFALQSYVIDILFNLLYLNLPSSYSHPLHREVLKYFKVSITDLV